MANPTKAQRATRAKKAATERRVASALAKYLKQANPGMKTAGAKVQKLKGGVIKITPIKANPRGGRVLLYSGRDLTEAREILKDARAMGYRGAKVSSGKNGIT